MNPRPVETQNPDNPYPDNPVPYTDAAVRAAIEALVVESAWAADHRDFDRVPLFYADDAEIIGISPTPVRGRAAIEEMIRSRPASGPVVATRHVVANLRLVQHSPDLVEGWLTGLAYIDTPGGTLMPRYVGEYHDRYVRTANGWLFQRRELTQTLRPASP